MSEFSISKIAGSAVNKLNDFSEDAKTLFIKNNKKFNYDDLIGAHLGGTSASASGVTTATNMSNIQQY